MDKQMEKLIEVNISGRVFAICQSRGLSDPTLMGHYGGILRQAVMANLPEQANPEEFNRVLEQQAAWLEVEIDQRPLPAPSPGSKTPAQADTQADSQKREKPIYIPKAMSMPERLAAQREGMEKLLENDCVTLKLITPAQAKQFKRRLLGKEPQKAEQELVAELRGILHEQVRKFIRKHKGGPWASATLQHELRMDIVATRSLRSLVTLARELLLERDEWIKQNRISLTGRLFGGRIRFSK